MEGNAEVSRRGEDHAPERRRAPFVSDELRVDLVEGPCSHTLRLYSEMLDEEGL
jgi:hypothetical protein